MAPNWKGSLSEIHERFERALMYANRETERLYIRQRYEQELREFHEHEAQKGTSGIVDAPMAPSGFRTEPYSNSNRYDMDSGARLRDYADALRERREMYEQSWWAMEKKRWHQSRSFPDPANVTIMPMGQYGSPNDSYSLVYGVRVFNPLTGASSIVAMCSSHERAEAERNRILGISEDVPSSAALQQEPPPSQQENKAMTNTNYSALVSLFNKELRGIAVTYEKDKESSASTPTAQRYVFKTLDAGIVVDDLVVIPTNSRHGFTVCKVVECDVDIEVESEIEYKWIVSKVDIAGYEGTLRMEAESITKIKQAERHAKREELKEKMFKNQEALRALPLYKNGDDTAPTASVAGAATSAPKE